MLQLELLMGELNPNGKLPSKHEVRQIFDTFDTDGDGCISFEEFQDAVGHHIKQKQSLISLFMGPGKDRTQTRSGIAACLLNLPLVATQNVVSSWSRSPREHNESKVLPVSVKLIIVLMVDEHN